MKNNNILVQPTGQNPQIYSLKEAENILGISHDTMYKLLNCGKIRNFHIGRRRMITHNAILDFIKDQEESEPTYAYR